MNPPVDITYRPAGGRVATAVSTEKSGEERRVVSTDISRIIVMTSDLHYRYTVDPSDSEEVERLTELTSNATKFRFIANTEDPEDDFFADEVIGVN